MNTLAGIPRLGRTMRWLLGAALALLAQVVAAHEVRPAYLEITPEGVGWKVLWKQPLAGDVALDLQPVFSGGWLQTAPVELSRTPTHLVKRWRVPAEAAVLPGQTITIAGLEQTITDTLVRIRLADGTEITRLLKPMAPSMQVEAARGVPEVTAYLVLGIQHILLGVDHLLFVLGLLLLVQGRARLVWTLTAFTLAHSLTLALSALQVVRVPVPLVEAAIALSIVFVAVEVVHLWRGWPGLSSRWPWAVAFAFGLLHGFGFAGALGDIGLPQGAVLPALLLFNAGVEVGQLLFVAALLAVYFVLRRSSAASLGRLNWFAPYAIGGLASFWFIERSITVLAG